nr:transcriptional regulator [Reyranella sp.]
MAIQYDVGQLFYVDRSPYSAYMLRSTTEDEMVAKRTMTLNLTDAEMRVLDELSVRKDITKTAVLRQALRLYQTIDARVDKGEKLLFENEATKEKAELMLL